MADDYKAEDLVNLIRKRYVSNDGAYNRNVILEQVPNGTGMFQSRWVDVAVFQMFPSEGLTRFAFEVKVSRTDFLNELKNPLKHKWCLECFHEFWFVAPKGVIQLEELPPNVGWMYPTAKGLSRARHAVRNPDPKLDDHLLAAFMRAAGKAINNAYKTSKDDFHKSDKDYIQGKECETALIAFLQNHNDYLFPEDMTKDKVIEHLEKATMDKQLQQDSERLLEITGRFQREILSLLNLFMIVASKSILARNELGKYIVSAYGIKDDSSLEALKEYAKNLKGFGDQKRYTELLELVMNWGKE